MTSHLPNPDQAVLDIRKIEDYCLNPMHPRGRHKARVFLEALDLRRGDAAWLREFLLEAVRTCEASRIATNSWGVQWRLDATITRHDKSAVVRTIWIVRTGESLPIFRELLGAMMSATKDTKSEGPSLLAVVALLTDIPAQQLARGQVGTVVEKLDDRTLLVEFSDEQGRAYAVAPCPRTDLLTLHYAPEAA